MVTTVPAREPVDSLITENAESTFEFPTSASQRSPQENPEASMITGEGDFREASRSWDAKPSGNDASVIAKKKLSDIQNAFVRNYRVASDTTDDFVYDNPWKAIVLAALGGVIVGMLVSR
ncbi:membrane protein [Caballeronia pedi]|uniref:Membrane protein n=1 Tax=Caballeronia pedi TaxID=1777141 RepID=A0A158E763_9BURK|nr:DUF883 domain-containing protein [Caballeronia pedi]SAL02688.1 membrane protein [Caballeronia pedi]